MKKKKTLIFSFANVPEAFSDAIPFGKASAYSTHVDFITRCRLKQVGGALGPPRPNVVREVLRMSAIVLPRRWRWRGGMPTPRVVVLRWTARHICAATAASEMHANRYPPHYPVTLSLCSTNLLPTYSVRFPDTSFDSSIYFNFA